MPDEFRPDTIDAFVDHTGACRPPRGACRPQDILVTAVPNGFLLARVLPHSGLEPWWEYVKLVRDRDVAMQEAQRLAGAAKTRVWFRDGESYEEIHG
jgi:hypothetical protein